MDMDMWIYVTRQIRRQETHFFGHKLKHEKYIFFFKLFFGCVFPPCISVHSVQLCACLVPKETRRGCQVPWN